MDKFTQLCVWPSTLCNKDQEKELLEFFKEEYGVRIKYEGCIETLPDKNKQGKNVKGTGGRSDLFFYIHTDDVSHFALPRLSQGIRWWEDVVLNNSHLIYSDKVLEKYPTTW